MPLMKSSRAGKTITGALIKIASLVGDDERLQEHVDVILNEQVKLKNIIIAQYEELAFLKGRISELEKQCDEKKEHFQQDEPKEQGAQKPPDTLIVSSGTMKKQEVATLIKNIDPTALGLQNASMKPGREGVIDSDIQRSVRKIKGMFKIKSTLANQTTEGQPIPHKVDWN